ncbi:hypothetical protein DFQ28_004291 [Apophysomyces sp. BC1034]|nr:hypothetical protein DFQ30_011119 [Apophysomyces sp. BC1015]KAG0176396.1 hypothetical protein DFQ29_006182 [Apophysomyces sp. BC1021]KAG0193624.1 hypothetical protein DFQ28_004291 [Apophysomyces sp. BC1034]
MFELANSKIYAVSYVTPERYEEFQRQLDRLANHHKCEVSYNFDRQSVDLDENKLEGTCPNYLEFSTTPKLGESSPSGSSLSSRVSSQQDLSNLEVTRITGRPLDLNYNDEEKGGNEYNSNKTESDGEESAPEEFHMVFTIAKNISDPREVVTGLPTGNTTQSTDYLRVIGLETETECSLIDRDIHIVGANKGDVQEALQRFKVIQALYKRQRKPTTIIPCIHYPTESPPYGLYFCDLDRYARKAYVDLYGGLIRPLYVLLPVFKDASGVYEKPKDLMDVQTQPVVPMQVMPPPQWVAHQQYQQQQSTKDQRTLNKAMQKVSIRQQPSSPKRRQPASTVVTTPNPSEMEMPLWGENRGFANNFAMSPAGFSPTTPLSPVPTQPSHQAEEEFPSLPSAPPKPTIAPRASQKSRRVLKLTPQKAPPATSGSYTPSSPQSLLQMAREYNLGNIKSALTDGLEGVRGFRGDIRLGAKFGKVLWSELPSEIQKKIWEFSDIKDVVMKEHGAKPRFNDVTTTSEEIIKRIKGILPNPFGKSSSFEIHAQARNQPIVPYKPVILHMNEGYVDLKKVVLKRNIVTEIDWVSLDRKFDFQMLLTTEELGRIDVKPFTTFIKKVSISPVTRHMTYENIPKFLEVSYILHKQVMRYKIHYPFVVEITRVEKVPLQPQRIKGHVSDKIMGVTGKGQVWYNCELFYTLHDEPFKANKDVPIGKVAGWTVDDILNGSPEETHIVKFIKAMLILVEKFESLF